MVNPQNAAQFQCLTCESLLLCYPCKVKHAAHPKRKNHQVVKFSGEADIIKIERLICQKHDKNFSFYCFQDEQPICADCNQPMHVEVDENNNEIAPGSPPQEEGAEEYKRRTVIVDEHKGHYVKALNQVLSQAESEKHKLKDGIMEQTKKIEAAVSYFAGLEEIFSGQRDLFLKKLNADFDVMQKMIERKRSELIDKVSRSYDGHVRKTLNYK